VNISGFQNKNNLLKVKNKDKWNLFEFSKVLCDDTKNATKIKTNEYLNKGKYPIVDQGKAYIAGYKDENDDLYNSYPCLIFGDHTKIIKYIDFPIYIGADGVKILKINDEIDDVNIKYIYYFLKTVDLPNEGYSRHFKYLKQIIIPIPTIDIQDKIVDVLEKSQALIEKRKKQINILDKLIESTFYDMFGHPFINNKNFKFDKLGRVSLINPKKSEIKDIDSSMEISVVPMESVGVNGEIDTRSCDTIENVYSNYTYFRENDVLFAKITPCMENGKGSIARNLINNIGFGSTEFHVIRAEEGTSTPEWIYHVTRLEMFRKTAEGKMTGSAGQRRVGTAFLENIKVAIPPIESQNQFAKIVNKIEKEKELLQQSLKQIETNFKALEQKAFNGELF
jgi:type I restriction enzyme S subunit